MNVEKWSAIIAQIVHDEFERRSLTAPPAYDDQGLLDVVAEQAATIDAMQKRIDELDLEKGEPGEPGPQGEAGPQGEPGEKGDGVSVGDVVQEVIKALTPVIEKMIPPAIPGEKGAQGQQGEPGAQGPAPSPEAVTAAVKALGPDIMAEVRKTAAEAAPLAHRGPYDEQRTYVVGDEVIVRGSTYRKTAPTEAEPPGEGWQMISQGKIGKKGLPGERGLQGPPGADGVGIKSITFADGQVIVELTNGHVEVAEADDMTKAHICGEGSAPNGGQFVGQLYFDTKAKKSFIWTGTKWEPLK